MHSIELVFSNKRNIPSTSPPSTCPQYRSKTKSKALLPIVGRIQNPQCHHIIDAILSADVIRLRESRIEFKYMKMNWLSYIWNHRYISRSRKSFQWVGTSLCLVLMYSVKQTITDRRNRLGTDSVECIECLHHWLDSGIIADVSMMMNFDEFVVIDD